MPEVTFIDESWTIDASTEEVFGLLEDVNGWPEWASKIKSASQTGKGPLSPGDTIEFTPDLLLPIPLKANVQVVEGPHRISWGVDAPGFSLEHRFEVTENGDSCEVHQHESAAGFLAPLGFPLKGLLYEFDKQWGDDLVEYFRSVNT